MNSIFVPLFFKGVAKEWLNRSRCFLPLEQSPPPLHDSATGFGAIEDAALTSTVRFLSVSPRQSLHNGLHKVGH